MARRYRRAYGLDLGERITFRVSPRMRARMAVRREALGGLSEGEYLRRLVENATLRVATDEGEPDGKVG